MAEGILPPNFDDVAHFAALERYLRGPGDHNQYDYRIQDVLTVAWSCYRHPQGAFRAEPGERGTAHNLFHAYKRHLQLRKFK